MKLELKDTDKFRFTEDKSKGIHKHEMLIEGEWVEVPGATSISGLFQEDLWKFQWPVKLMYEKLLEWWNSPRVPTFISDDFLDVLSKAKNAWREKRDKSADTGTAGHLWIENYIKGPAPEWPIDGEVRNIVDQFTTWEEKANPQWLASEVQVGSLTNRFAGILDAIAIIDGKTVLVDFKTSSGIKDDYRIQLAGLHIALEEMGFTPDRRAILHLPKEGKYEFRYIEGNLEEEKKDFLAGVAFYNRKNLFLARNKEVKKVKKAKKLEMFSLGYPIVAKKEFKEIIDKAQESETGISAAEEKFI